MNPVIEKVTQQIIERSKKTRAAYLAKIEKAREQGPHRGVLSCGNLAHGFAACSKQEKADLTALTKANVGIVSAYNDMLSAHQPYEAYPAIIKKSGRRSWFSCAICRGRSSYV
jgi:phosphogluconate dehydratase